MPDTQTLPSVDQDTDSKSKLAPNWKVLLHNDDKTTMEFVVWILVSFFGKSSEAAYEVMMEVHKTGIGIAGVYPREVAELKQEQAVSAARTRKYPLKVTIEPVEE